MTRSLVCVFVAAAVSGGAGQQPTPMVGALPSARPVDGPVRVIAAQQLALAAYPELRGSAVQARVADHADGGVTITFGIVEADGDTLLARSRPRTAVLMVDAMFDPEQRLTRAVLRGTLARSKERRDLRARLSGWTDALEQAKAAFPPSKHDAFVRQIDPDLLRSIVGRLTTPTAIFQSGTAEDGLYWEVATTTATGVSVKLAFEPFDGRLIQFVRVGGQ